MTDTISISQRDARKLAKAIRRVTSHPGGDTVSVRAIIQEIDNLMPAHIREFRFDATGFIDLSGRNYLKELSLTRSNQGERR